MICSSVQPPTPVSRSGVMLVENTVPNGPSYLRPPPLTGCFFTVWQPQPPVAPKTYFPRASSAGDGAWAPAGRAAPGDRAAAASSPAAHPTSAPRVTVAIGE